MKNVHRQFQKEVLQLLKRSHCPLVRVRGSNLPRAGRGVFTEQSVRAGQVLCLYPGVYSAGLPTSIATSSDDRTVHYLGQGKTPSGVPSDINAYCLNLQTGGYFDGLALQKDDGSRLDENPSACAHFVNHSSTSSNVQVVPIAWQDMLGSTMAHKPDSDGHLFIIPNASRSEGAPWYAVVDELTVYYSGKEARYGAAFCAQEALGRDEELLLNYGLKHKLPSWAKDWYQV